MSKPQIIITGGTLCCSRNAEGLQVPDGKSLDALASKLGYGASLKPLLMDSIDFDMKDQYPKMLTAAQKVLDAGDTPVLTGGTDTLIWYSTLLTKDLMRRGYLQEGSDQKIVFLSSMRTIEEAPEQIEGILKAGKLVAEQKGLSGGFALSAIGMQGKRIDVHNVLNHFDKISARLINALRSDGTVEYLYGDTINPHEHALPTTTTQPSSNRGYARIAPPLLQGHDSEAVLAYLQHIGNAQLPYDGVIIEGLPMRMHRNDKIHIPQMVQKLTQAGTRVMFCNPMRCDNSAPDMSPVIDGSKWNNGGDFFDALNKAGAEFKTALPKDVYIDMMLETTPGSAKNAAPLARPLRNQKVFGLRYVPDVACMSHTLDMVAPHAKNIVFSALPGSVLPNSMLVPLKRHQQDTRYHRTFDYTGREYVDHEGKVFTESPENHYASGQETGKLVKPCTVRANPVWEIYRGRPVSPKDDLYQSLQSSVSGLGC